MHTEKEYFLFGFPISKHYWNALSIPNIYEKNHKSLPFFRTFTFELNKITPFKDKAISTGHVYLLSILNQAFRYIINSYTEDQFPVAIEKSLKNHKLDFSSPMIKKTVSSFISNYRGKPFLKKGVTEKQFFNFVLSSKSTIKLLLKELLVLHLSYENPATEALKPIYHSDFIAKSKYYKKTIKIIFEELTIATPFKGYNISLIEILLSPIKANPHSLQAQLEFLIKHYGVILPKELFLEAFTALDVIKEETKIRGIGQEELKALDFKVKETSPDDSSIHPEPEQFSPDIDWMSNVVLIAKMTYVWLHQLSKKYGREINRLDQIPDQELDQLAAWGINALWLIGVWKRSPASEKIKHLSGNIDAIASAYSLYNYEIAEDLGGEAALNILKKRAYERGIRLATDIVPNHTGIYSEWIIEHPDWFIQREDSPFPNYTFTGENLSFFPEINIFIEDGYWTKKDAAVVFKYVNNRTGKTRYIYHGNDGTSTPWNDTAQLNYLLPEVREAVIQTIINVAKKFHIIRFDAAMTLSKRHFQRLWFPKPGEGGAIPSRTDFSMSSEEFNKLMPREFWREVVDRISIEAKDTLLLAEAFWLMEGYFVRTLGMHRVYNSAFMNMIKMEENSKYSKTIKNVIEFEPEILKRFVNFMNNPDEKTAIEQFGKESKYFGTAVMLVTMPGLPMFGHGQIEGFQEKYGMEYKRCYWDEKVDEFLVKEHEKKIFPLLKKRYLFSDIQHFTFYDFYAGEHIDENVFAYTNMCGEERAVVVYHNKFASTEGWFKTSTPFLKKNSDGSKFLQKKTVGEALNFKNEEGVYYVFTDYSNMLQYTISGKEIFEKGFYFKLNAYEYHVLLDFKEVIDDQNKIWASVCTTLNKNGVKDIYEVYKTIKYKELLEHANNFVYFLTNLIENVFNKDYTEKPNLDKVYYNFNNLVISIKNEAFVNENNLPDFNSFYKQLESFISILYSNKKYFSNSEFKYKYACVITSIEILFKLLAHILINPFENDHFGLLPGLRTFFSTNNLSYMFEIDYEEFLKNLKYISNPFQCKKEDEFISKALELISTEFVKNFLLINSYDNILWFNKERFEELIISLMFLQAFNDLPVYNKKENAFKKQIKRLNLFIKMAKDANYQYKKLILMNQEL